MKKKSLLLLGGAILFATSCSTTPKYEQKNIPCRIGSVSGSDFIGPELHRWRERYGRQPLEQGDH